MPGRVERKKTENVQRGIWLAPFKEKPEIDTITGTKASPFPKILPLRPVSEDKSHDQTAQKHMPQHPPTSHLHSKPPSHPHH